jgi:hypothetical protein
MADAYIESAMLSLATAWSETGNGMSITCPQLSECLSILSRQVRSLYDESVLQKKIIDRNTTVMQNLTQEIDAQKLRIKDLTKMVDDLSSETTGFVRAGALNEINARIPDKAVVMAMKDELKKCTAQLAHNVAGRRELEELQREVKLLTATVEDHRNELVDETGTMRKLGAQFEADTKRALVELNGKIETVSGETTRKIDRLAEQLENDSERMTNELTLVTARQGETLENHSQEIVAHLKAHAEAIEALQTDRTERSRRMPTRDEVIQMRTDLDSVRKDLTESLFRVQEVYSQCQAMYTARGVAAFRGPVVGATGLPSYSNSFADDPTKGADEYGGRGGLLNDAREILGSIKSSSGVDQDIAPTSTELQVNMLKRDVHRMASVALPSCISQVQLLKDQVESMVRMNARVEDTLKSLCETIGLQDGGDELLAALQGQDYNRSIVILRGAFSVLMGSGYNYPSPSRSFRPRTATVAGSKADAPGQVDQGSGAAAGNGVGGGVAASRGHASPIRGDSGWGSTPSSPAGSPPHHGPPVSTGGSRLGMLAGGLSTSLDFSTGAPTGGFAPGARPGSSSTLGLSTPTGPATGAGPDRTRYDERYSSLPRLAALKADGFSLTPSAKPKGAPTLGIDCADNIGRPGIQVMQVVPGSSAARAGIEKGQTIVAVNGRSMKNCAEFLHLLSTAFLQNEGKVRFTVASGEDERVIIVGYGA